MAYLERISAFTAELRGDAAFVKVPCDSDTDVDMVPCDSDTDVDLDKWHSDGYGAMDPLHGH